MMIPYLNEIKIRYDDKQIDFIQYTYDNRKWIYWIEHDEKVIGH